MTKIANIKTLYFAPTATFTKKLEKQEEFKTWDYSIFEKDTEKQTAYKWLRENNNLSSDIDEIQAILKNPRVFNKQDAYLNLQNITISDINLDIILDKISQLKEVIFKHIKFAKYFPSQDVFIKVIKAISTSIKSLVLENCSLTDKQVEELVKQISKMKDLETLNLSYNFLPNADLSDLGKALSQTKIKGLFLANNNFNSQAIKNLAKNLKSKDLEMLDLSYNNISDEGAIALAHLIKELPNLRTLSLRSANIGDIGISAIAKSLRSTNSLVALDLANNNIGNLGAKNLAFELSASHNLMVLDLSKNKIADLGAIHISKLLRNEFISEINLYKNQITEKGAQEFQTAKLRKPGLLRFTNFRVILLSNPISPQYTKTAPNFNKHCQLILSETDPLITH